MEEGLLRLPAPPSSLMSLRIYVVGEGTGLEGAWHMASGCVRDAYRCTCMWAVLTDQLGRLAVPNGIRRGKSHARVCWYVCQCVPVGWSLYSVLVPP